MTLPSTFGELAEKIFDQLPKEQRVDFVTDSYHADSIKAPERERRGSSAAHLIKGPSTKIPRDWKIFLMNERNKENLSEFLLKEWRTEKYANKLQGKALLFVCKGTCTQLTSNDGKTVLAKIAHELESNHEEGDTKIVLHLLNIASSRSEDATITVRSPDTDVFVILLKYSSDVKQRILFDTGVGDKRRLIDVKKVAEIVGKDICSVLPSLHAFTGCDTTSAFVRKGKLAPLKTLQRNPKFVSTFAQLGVTVQIPPHVLLDLEEFVCILYRGRSSRTADINKLRFEKFQERFDASSELLSCYEGIDMSLLPPCRDSLRMHVQRANYQALVWNTAHKQKPDIPSPVGNGWKKAADGHRLKIEWTDGHLMPAELVDVLVDDQSVTDEDDSHGTTELFSYIDFVFEDEEH